MEISNSASERLNWMVMSDLRPLRRPAFKLPETPTLFYVNPVLAKVTLLSRDSCLYDSKTDLQGAFPSSSAEAPIRLLVEHQRV